MRGRQARTLVEQERREKDLVIMDLHKLQSALQHRCAVTVATRARQRRRQHRRRKALFTRKRFPGAVVVCFSDPRVFPLSSLSHVDRVSVLCCAFTALVLPLLSFPFSFVNHVVSFSSWPACPRCCFFCLLRFYQAGAESD